MERLPLGLIPSGCTAFIKEIRGNERLRQQLLAQGLVDGCRIRVVKNDTGGPLIISVNNTRLALGRVASLQVLVEEDNNLKNFTPLLVFTNISGKVAVEK